MDETNEQCLQLTKQCILGWSENDFFSKIKMLDVGKDAFYAVHYCAVILFPELKSRVLSSRLKLEKFTRKSGIYEGGPVFL